MFVPLLGGGAASASIPVGLYLSIGGVERGKCRRTRSCAVRQKRREDQENGTVILYFVLPK